MSLCPWSGINCPERGACCPRSFPFKRDGSVPLCCHTWARWSRKDHVKWPPKKPEFTKPNDRPKK